MIDTQEPFVKDWPDGPKACRCIGYYKDDTISDKGVLVMRRLYNIYKAPGCSVLRLEQFFDDIREFDPEHHLRFIDDASGRIEKACAEAAARHTDICTGPPAVR